MCFGCDVEKIASSVTHNYLHFPVYVHFPATRPLGEWRRRLPACCRVHGSVRHQASQWVSPQNTTLAQLHLQAFWGVALALKGTH